MVKTAQKNFTKSFIFWAVLLSLCIALISCKAETEDKVQKDAALYPLSIKLRSSAPNVDFIVERAVSRAEQEKGLMHREFMPDNHGMIFIYTPPQRSYFWMKNTLIPLDMIFIDSDNKILHIHKGAKPHDLTPIPSGGIVRATLEVNAGIVDKFGISVGDEVIFSDF